MSPSTQRARALVWGLSLLAVFPVAFGASPWILTTNHVLCPFRLATGRLCIFGGLTRAFAHATHGEFHQALSYHTLWWIAALAIAAIGITRVVEAVLGRSFIPMHIVRRSTLSWGAVWVVIVGSVVRAFVSG